MRLLLAVLFTLAGAGSFQAQNIIAPGGEVGARWIAETYDATDFVGGGSTWTVEEADVTTYAWTRVGNTMTVLIYLVNTTLAATPNNQIIIDIPESFVATKTSIISCVADDNGTFGSAYGRVGAAATTMTFTLIDNGNWATATDATDLFCTMIFEVNPK